MKQIRISFALSNENEKKLVASIIKMHAATTGKTIGRALVDLCLRGSVGQSEECQHAMSMIALGSWSLAQGYEHGFQRFAAGTNFCAVCKNGLPLVNSFSNFLRNENITLKCSNELLSIPGHINSLVRMLSSESDFSAHSCALELQKYGETITRREQFFPHMLVSCLITLWHLVSNQSVTYRILAALAMAVESEYPDATASDFDKREFLNAFADCANAWTETEA